MTTFSCFLAGSGASAFAIAAAGLAAGSGEMGAGDDCAAEAGGLPLCICGLARGSRKGLSEAAVLPKGCRRRRLTVGSTSGDSARAHGARWRARHGIALYSEWNFSMGRRRNGDRPVVTSRRTKQEVCKRQGDDERAGEHDSRKSVDFRRVMHFMHGGCGFSKRGHQAETCRSDLHSGFAQHFHANSSNQSVSRDLGGRFTQASPPPRRRPPP